MKNKFIKLVMLCALVFSVTQSFAQWPTFAHGSLAGDNVFGLAILDGDFEDDGYIYQISDVSYNSAQKIKNMMSGCSVVVRPSSEEIDADSAEATYVVEVNGTQVDKIRISRHLTDKHFKILDEELSAGQHTKCIPSCIIL
jgi:hypothetical protein